MAHIFDFSHITNYEKYSKSIDDRKIYIGHGTNGTVYKIFINGEIPIALKEITLSNKSYQKQIESYEKEATFLKNITHPNIIKVFFSFEHYNEAEKKRMYYIGMECASKSLEDIIDEKIKFTEQEASELASQLYRGLEFIQAKNAVHRDIKPANIVLGTDGFYKLCDFGEAQIQNEQIQTMALQSIAGSPAYFSPELLQLFDQGYQGDKIQEYNPALSEVFSFGLVILKCLLGTNKSIYGCNKNFKEIQQKIQEANLSNQMRSFLLNCLAFDRRNRYTFKKMKEIFEFNAIQAYFESQEFNYRASYESLQIQTASSFEEQRQINIELQHENASQKALCQNLQTQVSAISNECKELRAQLSQVTALVNQLQRNQEMKAQTQNQSPLKDNDSSKIIQYQQQPIYQQKNIKISDQQKTVQKQHSPIKKILTEKSQPINQNLVEQAQPIQIQNKENDQIFEKCYQNEKIWENQNQEWRTKQFTNNSQGLKWNNQYYNNNYKQYYNYYKYYYNNYQFWNDKTGQGQKYNTYWRNSDNGNAWAVCENDIPKAIEIVNKLANTTRYEFGLCLMMLHSNIWNFDKSTSDLMN